MLPWITEGFDLDNNKGIPSYLIGPKQKPFVSQGSILDATIPFTNSPDYLDAIERGRRITTGGKQIATGTAILLVPDPIPLVDEIFAIGLIGRGVYNLYTGTRF